MCSPICSGSRSAFSSRAKWGRSNRVLANDVPILQSAVLLVRDVLDAPLRIIAFLVYIFYLNWRLALLACLFLPGIALIIQRLGRQIHRITHQTQGSLADITALVQEALSGVRVIKSFAMEDRAIERFAQRNRQVLHHSLKGERRRARLRPTVEFIGAVSIALVLWFGGHQVASGQMTTGQLMSFLFLLHQIAQAANGIGALMLTRKQVRAAAERIFREVLDVEPEVYDPPDAIELPRLQGHIEFRNVSFWYPSELRAASHSTDGARGGEPALRNVSFTIAPGEVVALVGHSGAGKSTLVDLLLRFYTPQQGSISIDGYALNRVRFREPAPADRGRTAADRAVRRHGRREHRLWQARRHAGGDRSRGACRPRPRIYRTAARRLSDADRRSGCPPVGGREPAHRDCACLAARPAHLDSG
jgi:subfamily B ATP-binding cassette protein MsbA